MDNKAQDIDPASPPTSKLELFGHRISIPAEDINACISAILMALDVSERHAAEVADHLVDADLCGVESHGIVRILQYAADYQSGALRADATPTYQVTNSGTHDFDGDGGIGIPAMRLAFEKGCQLARTTGIAALAIRNVGHTGRHGAFADIAAQSGVLTFVMGGGNRKKWRQVAPHGGARAVLPTNPWCVGIPGGALGPVVLDFATSRIAGGWLYAARAAGALVPKGCVIDKNGTPTRDPADYFDGGAILPSGGHKGYALALLAELIGEAMLGPATTECNWLLICIDTRRYRDTNRMSAIAEEILDDLRTCPPAPGFDHVEIPGERERARRAAAEGVLWIPDTTWTRITELARTLGVTPSA